MPIFDDDVERAHPLAVFGHWSDEISYRFGERINYHGPHRARVLSNLRRQIKKRNDHVERGDQLRDRVERFQSHD